ncbi:uncharacterized protein [Glycine max]|uniref:uncharacterized protein isoform X2 n=1 Tax=Glycine max TaxID=3847 RepID=UPI001B356842|nr:uncharacterized protein LOC121172644 isoform X2 [Glycine max]
MLTTMVLNYLYTFVISYSRYLESIFNQYAAKYSGLELLLDILESTSVKQKGNASAALHKLAGKASSSVSLFDAAPPSTSHQDISVESVSLMYKMSEDFNDTKLKHACILFMLENFDKPRLEAWYCHVVPGIRMFLTYQVSSIQLDL